MEKELQTGMSADYAANRILKAVMYRQEDVLLGPLVHRLAVYGRILLPAIFFRLMAARAVKGRKEQEKDK